PDVSAAWFEEMLAAIRGEREPRETSITRRISSHRSGRDSRRSPEVRRTVWIVSIVAGVVLVLGRSAAALLLLGRTRESSRGAHAGALERELRGVRDQLANRDKQLAERDAQLAQARDELKEFRNVQAQLDKTRAELNQLKAALAAASRRPSRDQP